MGQVLRNIHHLLALDSPSSKVPQKGRREAREISLLASSGGLSGGGESGQEQRPVLCHLLFYVNVFVVCV